MKNVLEKIDTKKHSYTSSTDSLDRICGSICSEAGPSYSKPPKTSFWTEFLTSAFSVFEKQRESKIQSGGYQKKETSTRSRGWTATVKRIMNGGYVWRFQERLLGYMTGVSNSTSDIWLLGVLYKICLEDPSQDPVHSDGYVAFIEDFSSRMLMTYRKGFVAIGDSKYTSDVNWGCMLRSSQMLVAQAMLIHRLGRSWRKPSQQPYDQNYIEILQSFGDSEDSAFSIHNLIKAGEAYALAPGSWVGPYAMCRTWETLVRHKMENNELQDQSFPMAIYVVSGDEDGERGGAPVVCIEDASTHCSNFSRGCVEWSPILLLVPLVLGLEKINPRYLPLLGATFTFPQSLGILGGRPGASTYIVGVQDDKAFYLDPHDVQPVVNIGKDNPEADTSSYHCNVVRQVPLESIDPSLAIGFYCRDKDDFDDFCSRASELAEQSNGAPLFTVAQTRNSPKQGASSGTHNADPFDAVVADDVEGSTDEWQLL